MGASFPVEGRGRLLRESVAGWKHEPPETLLPKVEQGAGANVSLIMTRRGTQDENEPAATALAALGPGRAGALGLGRGGFASSFGSGGLGSRSLGSGLLHFVGGRRSLLLGSVFLLLGLGGRLGRGHRRWRRLDSLGWY